MIVSEFLAGMALLSILISTFGNKESMVYKAQWLLHELYKYLLSIVAVCKIYTAFKGHRVLVVDLENISILCLMIVVYLMERQLNKKT